MTYKTFQEFKNELEALDLAKPKNLKELIGYERMRRNPEAKRRLQKTADRVACDQLFKSVNVYQKKIIGGK